VASDSLIVPTQADSFCISGLADLKKQLDAIREGTTNKTLRIEGILLAKYSDRTRLNQLLKEELFKACRYLDTKIYNYAIRESVGVRESQLLKSNVLVDNPKNNASIDYQTFIDEFIRDNEKVEVLGNE
jgi:cellulose biosynthesis protein BcsQ